MKRVLMVCALAFGLLGCDDDKQAAPEPTPEPDAMAMDAGQDTADDVGGEDEETGEGPLMQACGQGYELPEVVGTVDNGDLSEISGLVASAHDPSVLWVHNDSGDAARVFAIDTTGATLGEVALPILATDIEDIAAATCPDGSGPCLWVADVGDNRQLRPFVSVYVFPEPEVGPEPFEPIELDALQHFRFTYPIGPTNVEGMVVLPDGSGLFLFEKTGAPTARVFAHTDAFDEDTVDELALTTTIDIAGLVTGADLHPLGTHLLLRTYEATFEYRLGEGQTLADLAEVAPILAGGIHSEPQGEAVGYSADGMSFFTVSEQRRQPLKVYRCAACDDGDACTLDHLGQGAMCSGTLVEDDFESNTELDGAALPRLDICPTSRSIMARQDGGDTEDWYKIEHESDCAPYVRLVNLGAEPREVCAWFACADGADGAVTCLDGEEAADSPEGLRGCCGTAGPLNTTSVRMGIDCGNGGDQVGVIHARVVAEASTCGLYELTRGNF